MIILDSSFVLAFHNERDVHHEAAARVMGDVIGGRWGRALLLEYVFLEVVTVVMAVIKGGERGSRNEVGPNDGKEGLAGGMRAWAPDRPQRFARTDGLAP